MPIQPIYLKNGPNGLNWQCCLTGSSKSAPRIAMGADHSYEVKNSEIWAPTFFKHNNSFIATVIPSCAHIPFSNNVFCELMLKKWPNTLNQNCQKVLYSKVDKFTCIIARPQPYSLPWNQNDYCVNYLPKCSVSLSSN